MNIGNLKIYIKIKILYQNNYIYLIINEYYKGFFKHVKKIL